MMDKVKKWEPYIFFLLILINLGPLFSAKYFVTLDGGAHNINAEIIRSLLFDSNSIYEGVYKINSEFIPNWSCHFLLVVLGHFFKYYIAEKILLCAILVLMPVFFRKIVNVIAPQNIVFSYLFFPFTNYILLYLGFYNFTIGVLFFLILIHFWLKNHQKIKWQQCCVLVFLFFAIYFSHIFIFLVAIIFLFAQVVLVTILGNEKKSFQGVLKKGLPIIFCALPFLILTAKYFINRPFKSRGELFYFKANEITEMITRGDAFFFDLYTEKSYTELFASILFFVFVLAIIRGAISLYKSSEKKLKVLDFLKTPGGLFFILFFLMFVLAYILPNDDGYGGYITIRFIYLGLIFLVLFSATQKALESNFNVLLLFVVGYSYFNLIEAKKDGVTKRSKERKELEYAFEKVDTHSTVLSFSLTNMVSWEMGHLVENVASERRVLVVGNYEASRGYFPIIWDCSKEIHYVAGEYDFVVSNCSDSKAKEIKQVDFVVVSGNKESNAEYLEIEKKIKNKFILVYESKSVNLFKKRS